MALTGELLADFSNFTRACDEAVVSLKGFESGAGQVQKSLDRMVDNFSGRKIIQDATLMAEAVERIGGVSKLTENELARVSAKASEAAEKLRAMGQAVPAGIQQIADASKKAQDSTSGWNDALSTLSGTFGALSLQRVIDEVIQFGKEIFNDADLLTRLSDRTAIGVETLQRLRIAGDDAGVGLDAMAGAMNKLQRNLGEGNTSTVGALQQLGLQLAALKAQSPEQQFYAVAEAIRGVQDPTEQVALAVALFGKSGADMLPVIKRGFDDVKDSASLMSRESVKAIDDAGDAAAKFARYMKSQFGEAIADILTGTTAEWRRLKSAMEDLPKVGPPIANMWGQVLPPTVPKELDDIVTKSDAWAKESKAVADAMVELNSVGIGWHGTLETIDGAVVEAIKYYLEAGVAQDKLATAYGVTAAQVKAVASEMKAEDEAMKLQATSVAEATKLWDEYDALRVQHGGTATEARIAQIDRWYRDTVAKLQLMGTYNEQTATAVWSVWQEKLAGVNVKWEDVRRHSKESLQEVADQARATADYVLANSSDYTAQFIRLKQEEAEAAERAAYHWRDTFDEAGQAATQSVVKAADEMIAKFGEISHAAQQATLQMGGTFGVEELTATQFEQMGGVGRLQQIAQSYESLPGRKAGGSGITGLASTDSTGYYAMLQEQRDFAALMEYAKGHKIPGFAEGVTNFSGGPAIVGERGPELLYLPTGSSVVPQTGASVVVQNTFHLVDTESNLARRVSDLIKQSILRSTRIS